MPEAQKRDPRRQRNTQACIPCQRAKRRCSTGLPCSYCIQRDRIVSCVYDRDGRKRQSSSLRRVSRRLSELPPSNQLSEGVNDPGQLQPIPLHNVPGETPEIRNTTQSRILQDSSGNDVFVGNTAITAFLPLVRNTFRRHIGPSRFTEYNYDNTMLETCSQPIKAASEYDQTDVAQKRDLVNLFFYASSGIIDVLEPIEVMQDLEAVSCGSQLEDVKCIFLDLVIAIGARCHPDYQTFAPCGRAHMDRVWSLVNMRLLDHVTLDTVRIGLLAAFYMLCACRRNTGYMYLGIAARASHTLGLHYDESLSTNTEGHHVRLCVLDFLVSSLVGRPAAASPRAKPPTDSLRGVEKQGSPCSLALDAIYRLFVAMDSATYETTRESCASAKSANIILEKLKDWTKDLDSSLRSAPADVSGTRVDRALIIGNVHLACFYYFSVMLITRPYLIYHIQSKEFLGRYTDNTHSVPFPPNVTPGTNAETSRLAETSVESAVFLIETCQEALQKNMLLDNMCLLQAVSFAAALIVGLALFMEEGVGMELTKVLQNAIGVLKKLATRSQQAERYYDILINLQADVSRRQEQILRRSRQSSNRPVSKILCFDGPPVENRDHEYGLKEELHIHGPTDQTPYITRSSSLSGTEIGMSLEDSVSFIDWKNFAFDDWEEFVAFP